MEINDIIDVGVTNEKAIVWLVITIMISLLLSIISYKVKNSTVSMLSLCIMVAWITMSFAYSQTLYEKQKTMLSEKISSTTGLSLTEGLKDEDYDALLRDNGYAKFRVSKNKNFYTVIAENYNNYLNFYQYKSNGIYIKMNSGEDLKFPDISKSKDYIRKGGK